MRIVLLICICFMLVGCGSTRAKWLYEELDGGGNHVLMVISKDKMPIIYYLTQIDAEEFYEYKWVHTVEMSSRGWESRYIANVEEHTK